MEKITLDDFLRKLVNECKGDQNYNLFDVNASMVIVTTTAKLMLETIGYMSFLNQKVFNIILDCEVIINVSKR